MKQRILQSIADSIYNKLINSESDDMFEFYYELGMWLDNLAINYMDVWLE